MMRGAVPLAHIGRHQARSLQRNAVLQVEDIRHVAVEAVCPDRLMCTGIDQFHGDAQLITGSANAATQHVAYVKLSTDLLISGVAPA